MSRQTSVPPSVPTASLPMSHSRAVALMILVCLMWATAGPVTRTLERAQGVEVTFWRSLAAALTVALWLAWRQGRHAFAQLVRGGVTVWISGAMWAVMFTCFTVSVSLTQVANVLVVQALTPVLTAIGAAAFLRQRIEARTWLTIVAAALGVGLMYVFDVAALDDRHLFGVLVALGIPVAAAINWLTLQRSGPRLDLSGAVLLGGGLSAGLTLAWAWPFEGTTRDIILLCGLGVLQLGVPCLLAMRAMQYLSAPEAALLSLLEIVFGVILTWVFGAEAPGAATLLGGGILLAALVAHESRAWRRG